MKNKLIFNNGTNTLKTFGVIGSDREVLRGLFVDDDTPKLLDKLTNLQKKVIRKMGWNKEQFLK